MTVADKLPPFDGDAEESVLGSLLIDDGCLPLLVGRLSPADFFRDANRWCFEAALALYERGVGINLITLAEELTRRDRLEEAGGAVYLHHLVTVVPTSLHAAHYAGIVRQTSLNRQIIQAAGQIAAWGYENRPDAEKVIAQAEGLLSALNETGGEQGYVSVSSLIEVYMENMVTAETEVGRRRRIPTGYSDLDRILGGLQGPDLIVIAARPSVGKSSLLLNLGLHAARQEGVKVGLVSLEMGKEQLLQRLVAMRGGIDLQRLRLGQLSERETMQAMDALGELSELPLFFDDASSQDMLTLRSRAKRLAKQRGLDLLLVDYLQLIQGSGRHEGRTQEVGAISRGLKGLAKELGIPVVAAAQLSRKVEERAGHVPMLSDLRESGEIEANADIVLFIHREEMYVTEEEWFRKNPTKPYPKGIADIIVAKHRNGPTGQISLMWQAGMTSFFPLEWYHGEGR